MRIRYFGHSCFQICADGVTLLTDPYTNVGYELPEGLETDVLTMSHGHFDHHYAEAVRAKTRLEKAGKYLVNGMIIEGTDSAHDAECGRLRGRNVIFRWTMGGVTFCHLGDLGEPYSEEIAEKIGKPDVLFLPVGGTYTLDAAQAKVYADKIGAKITIPMHYRPEDGALDITSCEPFLTQYAKGRVRVVQQGEYEFTKESLDAELPIVYMERIK